MLCAPSAAVAAIEDPATARFLQRLRLSDVTAEHFSLQAFAAPGQRDAARLTIPVHDAAGEYMGDITRALHDHADCRACGQQVTAAAVAYRRRAAGGDEWQRCPHCDASKKNARVSWLLGQYPTYTTSAGLRTGELLYNEHRAAAALTSTSPRNGRGAALVVCEGPTDTWALHEAGFEAVVSYMAARPTEDQLDRIAELAVKSAADRTEVIVAADSDTGGQVNAERAARGLRDRGVRIVRVVTTYGDDAKDAAQALQRHGALRLAASVLAAA